MKKLWKFAKEYRAWSKMISRCCNEKDPRYKLYGHRGIKVCDRWLDDEQGFHNFLEDMGRAPTRKHTLERKDNDGGYHPGNCRWATWKEQACNRSTNRLLSFAGEILTMSQWADRLGVDRRVIWKRLRSEWTLEKTLTTPLRSPRRAA